MAITLNDGTTTLTLDEDLIWTDEFGWNPVQSAKTYSIGGALLFDNGVKLEGRPITLSGGEDYGWLVRSLVQTLVAWASIPRASFTLNIYGVNKTVAFDLTGQAVEANPVVDYNGYASTDWYIVTLRFLEKA